MIHRTRQGGPPSSAPEAGRKIVKMGGDIWIEYSGPKPTAAELDAYLKPAIAPPSVDAIDADISAATTLAQLKAALRGKVGVR